MGTTLELSRRIQRGTFPESQRWDSSALFAANEPGVDFARIDPSILFQDSAGTTPVTAPGQPVGLVLDKSKGLVLGSELVTNGDFSGGTTGWIGANSGTISVTGGVLEVDIADVSNSGTRSNTAFTVVAGKTYRVQVRARKGTYTGTALGFRFPSAASALTQLQPALTSEFQLFEATVLVAASSANAVIQIQRGESATGTIYIDSVSIRELPGNHASQATAASRPIYGVVPKGGRRNILLWSEEFNNTAWAKANSGTASSPVVVADAGIAPNGTMTADRITFTINGGTTSSDRSDIFRESGVLPSGTVTTTSVWLRSESGSQSIAILDGGMAIVTITEEWARYTYTHTRAADVTNPVGLRARGDLTGDVTVLAWGIQHEIGSTPTPYQRVVTAQGITEQGVPTCHYLQFDGVDDWLSTAAIDFSGTDEVTCFTGVRRLGDGNVGTVLELSGNSAATNGTFALFDRGVTSPSSVTFRVRGDLNKLITIVLESLTPLSSVYSGVAKNSTNYLTLSRNGLDIGGSGGSAGAGNLINSILYVGRRAGTSLPFHGRIFGLIARGVLSSTAEIRQAEKLLARRTSEVTLL